MLFHFVIRYLFVCFYSYLFVVLLDRHRFALVNGSILSDFGFSNKIAKLFVICVGRKLLTIGRQLADNWQKMVNRLLEFHRRPFLPGK